MESNKDIYIPRRGELVRFVGRSSTSRRNWGKAGEYYLVHRAELASTGTAASCWFAGESEDICCLVAPTEPPAFLPDCDLPCIGHLQVNLRGATWVRKVKAYILKGNQSILYPLDVVPWGLVNEAMAKSTPASREAALEPPGANDRLYRGIGVCCMCGAQDSGVYKWQTFGRKGGEVDAFLCLFSSRHNNEPWWGHATLEYMRREALEASQPSQEVHISGPPDPCPDCKRERGHSLACPQFWDWVAPVRTPTPADVAAMEMRLSWIKSEEAKEKAQERKGVDQAWLAARRAAYHQAPDLDLNQYYFDRGLGLPAPTVEEYLAQRAVALDLAIQEAKKQGPAYQYPHWPEHIMNPNYED